MCFKVRFCCKYTNYLLFFYKPGNLLKDYDKLTQMLNVPAFGVPLPRPKQPPLMGPPPGATLAGAPPQVNSWGATGAPPQVISWGKKYIY